GNGQTERQAVLRRSDILWSDDHVMAENLLAGGGPDPRDVVPGEAMLPLQALEETDRGMGRDMRGVAFHADAQRFPASAEAVEQTLQLRPAGERLEHAEPSFQDAIRSGEAALGKARR